MKLAKTMNLNYLWLLLGSYFVAMMVNLLSFSTKELFLELGKVGWGHSLVFDGEQEVYLHTKIEYLVRGRYSIYFYSEKSEPLYVIGLSFAFTGLVSIFLFRKRNNRLYLLSGRCLVFSEIVATNQCQSSR